MTGAEVLKEDVFASYFDEHRVRLMLDKGNSVEGTLVAQDAKYYYLSDATYYAIRKSRLLAVPVRRVQLVCSLDE